ncbi:MAG: acyl carrier protein [Candidatus Bathyarchaeota archaeon]|nr:acyl carrier protein [Candidatus Bathyarchaeota archaeon]
MTSSEEKLREIAAKVLLLQGSEVNDNISRKDTEAWDSLAHLMLINETEATFEVSFSDDDILEINSIGDLRNKLRKLGVET